MHKIGLREIFSSSGTIELKAFKLCDYIFGSLAVRLIPVQAIRQLPSDPSRILVIRPGGIGDAVFLLPIFRSLKLKNPQVQIDVLCQRRNAQVFFSQGNLVDHVFVFESLKDVRGLYKKHYDIVVDTEQWHYLTALLALSVRSQMKIGFSTRPLRYKLFNLTVNYDDDAYELDNFLSLFESLIDGQHQINKINNCYELSPALKSWAEGQIPSNSVVISMGASVPERRLSVEQMVILAKGLLHRGFHPVILGGKDVLLQSLQMMEELDAFQVYNFVGKISLPESAALIKASRAFIGTDSGLMHLACAVDSPVIVLFGAGNMKKWMRQDEKQISVNEFLPCSPCTAFGYGLPTCRGAYPCLRKMDLESILDRHLPAGV